MSEVVVIGSTNWDITMYLPTLPAPGETVAGGTLASGLGGKGANQAVAAWTAGGAQTAFVSCIGDDDIAVSVRDVLGTHNLPMDFIDVTNEAGTGSACIFVDDNAENSIGIASGANAFVLPALVDRHRSLIENARVVLMQLEVPIETVIAAAKIAEGSAALFVLNPAPAQVLPEVLLPLIDILTPNRIELAQLSGAPTLTLVEVADAARIMLGRGVGAVVVTLGGEGCLVVTGDDVEHIPAIKVVPVDTTAAGDVFNGALVADLSRGAPLPQAVRTGGSAAAIAVTRKGAIASIPTREEVLAALQD